MKFFFYSHCVRRTRLRVSVWYRKLQSLYLTIGASGWRAAEERKWQEFRWGGEVNRGGGGDQVERRPHRLHFLLFLTTLPPLVSARKKKRYKRQRKSKWSTGVIKKPKKKKSPSLPSSSSSSVSSRENSESGPEENGVVEMRVLNGSADPSSSCTSESSDWEQNHLTAPVNGYHHHLNSVTGIQNGGLVNGYHHPEPMDLRGANGVPRVRLNLRNQTSNPPRPLKRAVNGVCLSKIGLYVSETEASCEFCSTNASSPDCD